MVSPPSEKAIVLAEYLAVVVSIASATNISLSVDEVYSILNPLAISSLGYINCGLILSAGSRIL